MKSSWVVSLVKSSDVLDAVLSVFAPNYFPHRFHYKKEANDLQKFMKTHGVNVKIAKV
jgi:hypothetical protein